LKILTLAHSSISFYAIINRLELASLLGIKDDVQLLESHRKWVTEILKNGLNNRDTQWTESIAVGDKEFGV
jgi:hypothetical protein